MSPPNPFQAAARKSRIGLWLAGTAAAVLSIALFFDLSVVSYSAPVACIDGDQLTLVYRVDTLREGESQVASKERGPGQSWRPSAAVLGSVTAAARVGSIVVRFDGSEATWEQGGKRIETRHLADSKIVAAVVPEIEGPKTVWAIRLHTAKDLSVVSVDPISRVVTPVGSSFSRPREVVDVKAAPQAGGMLVAWREVQDEDPTDEVRVAHFDGVRWEEVPGFVAPALTRSTLAGQGDTAWWFGITDDYKRDGDVIGTMRRRSSKGWAGPIEATLVNSSRFSGRVNGFALVPEGNSLRLLLTRYGTLQEVALPAAPTEPFRAGPLTEFTDAPAQDRARVWVWGAALMGISVGLLVVGAGLLRDRLRLRKALEAAILDRARRTRKDALRRRSLSEVANAPAPSPSPMPPMDGLGAAVIPNVVYASVFQRGVAFALDFFLFVPVGLFLMQQAGIEPTREIATDDPRLWTLNIILQGMMLVYFVFCEGRCGQTFGKYAMGIKVIRLNGEPIGWGGAFARNMMRVIEIMTPIFLVLPLGSILMTRHSQRIGDLAAGTIVIRRPRPVAEPEEDEF